MKLTFTDAKIQTDNGVWLCLKVNEPAPAKAFVMERQNRVYDCEIKQHKNRRSLDANAYCWVLIDKISQETALSKTEIYRHAIKETGGVYDTVCVMEKAADRLIKGWEANGLGWFAERFDSRIAGCVNVTLYYGSSVYDTAQMSRLIDYIAEDCRSLGIETLPPEKLDAMKEQWCHAQGN